MSKWDERIRVNGHDVTYKMPLTMAVLREQQETKMTNPVEEVSGKGFINITEVYDDGVERPAHSDKGASGAERWMNCPGSSALIAAFDMPQTDEPDYQREGIAQHEAAADCLARDIDTWEIVGETYHGTVMDGPMCDAIQMYLDRVRPSIDRVKGYHGEQFFIEAKLAAPDVHEKMFGSVDFGALVMGREHVLNALAGRTDIKMPALGFLDVTDYKGGEGIEVAAEDNAQMKYYAFMLIHTHYAHLPDDFPVRLTIVQPRCWSYDGPIRDWWTTVGEIKAWVVRELLPAMNSTDNALLAGKWCRFCPAKLTCPLLVSLFRAASIYNPKEVIELSSEGLGLSYTQVPAVKFYLKALEDEVYRRLMVAQPVPHTKLVNKKAHRVFKETVTVKVEGKETEVDLPDYMRKTFGKDAVEVSLKSPPEFEKMSPAAREFVKEYAYMPTTGLTVALDSDRRTGIIPQSSEERFGSVLDAMKAIEAKDKEKTNADS